MNEMDASEILMHIGRGRLLVCNDRASFLVDRDSGEKMQVPLGEVRRLIDGDACGRYKIMNECKYDWYKGGRRGWLSTLGPVAVQQLLGPGSEPFDFDVWGMLQ